ncbi:MAG: AraC family transcriptional regulator [Flavobacteriaceae bacterium]|nr:AraC family transcriptional regulator [Flavobacteriaceae bacterium]
MKVFKEITPLTQNDVFVIINSEKIGFEYPIHYHSAYELTLVLNSSGNRIIGDSVEKYGSNDLVLIGPEIYHKWDDDDVPPTKRNNAHVITIQFSKNLFNQSLFLKDDFISIKNLLKDSQRGLKFTGDTFKIIALKIHNLVTISGFNAVIEFLKILQLLSISNNKKYLAGEGFISIKEYEKGDRVNKMYKYILANFNNRNLRINDLADEANMSPSAFGHFFKKCTNKSFTQFVVDLRLGHASKLLIDSNLSISEIAFISGFNNIANFNRLFKKNKFFTPKHYRQELIQTVNFNWRKQLSANQFIPS